MVSTNHSFISAKSTYFIDLNTEGLDEDQIRQAVHELTCTMRKRVLSCYTDLFFQRGENVTVSDGQICRWGSGTRSVSITVEHLLRTSTRPNMVHVLEVIANEMREAAAHDNKWNLIHPLATSGRFSTYELFMQEKVAQDATNRPSARARLLLRT